KGMWMGGTIPLGYDVKDRKLTVNEAEAKTVRLIFQRYLALGCVSKLRADLDQKGVRSKQRILTSGQALGGGSFGRGALYHLLRNRIYRGEVEHKGIAYPGEHKAIVDEELWIAVQSRLSSNVRQRRRTQVESGALLTGLIFDESGNRMSPTYTVRRGNRYRYYIGRAVTQDGGALLRVAAEDIERIVLGVAARTLSRNDLTADAASGNWNTETRNFIQEAVERITVHDDEIHVVLKTSAGDPGTATEGGEDHGAAMTILKIPCPAARARARKEILVPGNAGAGLRRIDQALILAVARAKSWMRALRRGEYADTVEIARRFGLSHPHVRRLLRFAYLAPDIVEAIVQGRQPRSLTVKLLLRRIPLAWSDQRAAFGFSR